ncbi:MAG: shikimate kinase [Desulfohalobiaceae bacterium]
MSRFIKEKVHVQNPDEQKVRRHGESLEEPTFSLQRGNIVFLGLRGSGKSTVAREVASRLGAEMVDTDKVIQERAGKSIAEIVNKSGWQAFRDLEEEVLKETCDTAGHIVATGGGVVLGEANRQRLRSCGAVFYLMVGIPLLVQRLHQDEEDDDERPALSQESLEEELVQTLRQREPLYYECLDYLLFGERTPRELADKVLETLKLS